jgi:hypothetical protein|tara:strand:- start:247 stop:504 length:258 start_codon:yes stop_codon:yes gene_type:complete
MIIMELPENTPTKNNDAEFNAILKKTCVESLKTTSEKIVALETALNHLRDTKWDLVDTLKEMGHDFRATPEGMDVILSAPPNMRF